MDEFRPRLHGQAVEIGAGIGSYSQELLSAVAALDAVEPSPALFERLLANLGSDPRVRVLKATAEQWVATAAPQSYDTVVMINVLEHIDDDVDLLRRLQAVMRPGAHLLLFVPALMALYSPLDEMVGHRRRYGKAELCSKVEAAGLVIRHCRFFDILGVLPWLVVNRWLQARSFNSSAAQIYDAIGVPMTRAIEQYVSPPIGKNLILAAMRPAS